MVALRGFCGGVVALRGFCGGVVAWWRR